jgi:hypothetical protein
VTIGSLSALWRGAAVLYALAIVLLSLLPPERMPAWAPDPELGVGGTAIWLGAGAGLLALIVLTLRAPRTGGGLKVASGLRLSRPLSVALIVYLAGLALIASGDLRAGLWSIAVDWVPAWSDLAAERLAATHAMAYAGLGLLIALGWGHRVDLRRAGLLVLALSGVLELLQGAVPGRTPNGWDLLANGFGLAVGLAAGRLLRARSRTVRSGTTPRHRHRRRHRRAVPEFAMRSSTRRGQNRVGTPVTSEARRPSAEASATDDGPPRDTVYQQGDPS